MSVPNGAYTRTNGFGPDPKAGYVRFHMEENPPVDPVASEREGRAVYCLPKEMIEIIFPGALNTCDTYVTADHRQTYPEQYAAFKKGEEIAVDGIPLEDWPRLTKHQIRHLKTLDFLTIEHIANASDTVIQRVGMGGANLRALAKAFLDDAESNALNERLTREGERKDAQISELSNKVEELSKLVNQLHGHMQEARNAQPALATYIPGVHDPIEQMKNSPDHAMASPFDSVALPKRGPGRPRKDATA